MKKTVLNYISVNYVNSSFRANIKHRAWFYYIIPFKECYLKTWTPKLIFWFVSKIIRATYSIYYIDIY